MYLILWVGRKTLFQSVELALLLTCYLHDAHQSGFRRTVTLEHMDYEEKKTYTLYGWIETEPVREVWVKKPVLLTRCTHTTVMRHSLQIVCKTVVFLSLERSGYFRCSCSHRCLDYHVMVLLLDTHFSSAPKRLTSSLHSDCPCKKGGQSWLFQ